MPIVDGYRTKKPFLKYVDTSTAKLILRESSEQVMIKNRNDWFIGIILLAFGALMISMPIIITLKEGTFNLFATILAVGVSLIFLVPAYKILAYANAVLLKHWSNTIHLRFGFYPFVQELSFPKNIFEVSFYKCDIERANRVKKPEQIILSLVRRSPNDSELVLCTSDTESTVLSAFEKLESFIGQSSQDELSASGCSWQWDNE
ncbi:MAG: hypothetical protein ACXABY_36470 [Candidatus Thorarchaeota archaeon]|jgi:hypothetical protein